MTLRFNISILNQTSNIRKASNWKLQNEFVILQFKKGFFQILSFFYSEVITLIAKMQKKLPLPKEWRLNT